MARRPLEEIFGQPVSQPVNLTRPQDRDAVLQDIFNSEPKPRKPLSEIFAAAPPPKERGFLEDAAMGGGRILTERGIGIIQLLDEATGGALLSPAAREGSYRAMQKLEKEKEDEGAGGTIASFTADPLMALPFAKGLKGVKALAASGAVTGAASQALSGKTSENQDRLANTAIGGAIGAPASVVFGKAIDTIASPLQATKNAASYLGKALKVTPENVKTFDLAGIEPTLGDVSSSKVVKRLQNVLDDVPIASSIIDRGKERVSSQIDKQLSKAGYDFSLEPSVGGAAAEEGLTTYIKRGKEFFNKAFDDFDKKIVSKGEPTSINNTFNKIIEISQRADTPEAMDAYLGATEKDIINKIRTAVTDPTAPELSYNDLKLFRTSIGKKLEDFTIGSSDKAILRELYGSLTADLRSKASEKGASSLKAFDRLNGNYAKFLTKLDNNITGVLSKGEAKEIFSAIRSGVALPDKTASILKSMPQKNRDILRGSLIRELGVDRTMAGQGEFNAARFASKFKALDPKAQKAFLTGLPKEVQANFMKVVDAAALAAKTSLQGNPSGTARNSLLVATAAGGANPATMAFTAKLIASGAVTAKMMTSPRFIKWLANAPKNLESNPGKYIAKLSAIAAADAVAGDDIQEFQSQFTDLPTPNQ